MPSGAGVDAGTPASGVRAGAGVDAASGFGGGAGRAARGFAGRVAAGLGGVLRCVVGLGGAGGLAGVLVEDPAAAGCGVACLAHGTAVDFTTVTLTDGVAFVLLVVDDVVVWDD